MPPTGEDEFDVCEPVSEQYFVLVTAEEGATEADIKRALRDDYTKHDCHHEYDCCGCRSYSVDEVVNLGGPVWRVDVQSSRNF